MRTGTVSCFTYGFYGVLDELNQRSMIHMADMATVVMSARMPFLCYFCQDS